MTSSAVKARLQKLLNSPEYEDNMYCADCRMRNPTWASTNLGVFVCLDCSAVHRAMGTHISKVKSTTLDRWTKGLVEGMEKMGNKRANAYWEAGIAPGYARPESPHAREQFIRQKYERKAFRTKEKASSVHAKEKTGFSRPQRSVRSPALHSRHTDDGRDVHTSRRERF